MEFSIISFTGIFVHINLGELLVEIDVSYVKSCFLVGIVICDKSDRN